VTEKKSTTADDGGTSTLEEANEAGYLGANTDPTPDEAYSVAGVTSGAETPETVEPGAPTSTKTPDAPTPPAKK
jgi:hypothetical protein